MARSDREIDVSVDGAIAPPPPIDIMAAFESPPPPIDYVLPGMVAGTVGALVSPGGVGKSMLALQVAAQIAGGPDLLGLGDLPTGRAVYLPAEDPSTDIRHRMHALWWCMTPAQQDAVDKGMLVQPLDGSYPNIMDDGWLDWLQRTAEGCRLMVLDPLRRFYAAYYDNNGQMMQVLWRMESIAASTGCAVLFADNDCGLYDREAESLHMWQLRLEEASMEEAARSVIGGRGPGDGVILRAGWSASQPTREILLRYHAGGVLKRADSS